jgi:baculoviral IAP repeat-containing protein 6
LNSAEGKGKPNMAKIMTQVSALVNSLPFNEISSIFVLCDPSQMRLLKALIIGPSNTPYENGCFEFDMFLPSDYPNSPPKMQLLTTNNGQVRFNPNLYGLFLFLFFILFYFFLFLSIYLFIYF